MKRALISKNASRFYYTHRELRKSFLDYFESKSHKIIKSSSLIPDESDGSLLFTNAGMNQFKSIIASSSENPQKLKVANIQKCIRAGGKHNDLDDVGKDLHHQTFFEMMGNWSFNDAYSKQQACNFAWKYLTDILKIDADRLYVSYFGGSKKLRLEEDIECREIWKKVGVPENKILPFKSENFWEMGSTGPCGPCTEIHYDRIGNRNASHLVNSDDSVVEIWNIVFMSNLRYSNGQVDFLARNHIDTGMGFERLLSIIQNKGSNFDTDVFTPILDRISEICPEAPTYSGLVDLQSSDGRRDMVFRLLADHVRAVTFAVSDGALPGSTGVGFVVRKMMRRMFIQSSEVLKMDRFALPTLVDTVVQIMGESYPEIESSKSIVKKHIVEEESQFWKVVDKAKRVFNSVSEKTNGNVISGKDAFNLYETYGLPLSITVELARNVGKTVNEKEFNESKSASQEFSKKSSMFTISASVHDYPTHSDQIKYKYEYKHGKLSFPNVNTRILGIYKDGEKVESLKSGRKGWIVLEECQFYGEQGGQTSDEGVLKIGKDAAFLVESAKKSTDGQVTLVFGEAVSEIRNGTNVEQFIDVERRLGLMRAHSATHLLNWALRKMELGNGQKGSLVERDNLRFDYSTTSTQQQLDENQKFEKLKFLETIMIEYIKKGGDTKIHVVSSIEDAKKFQNLQAVVKEDKIGGSSPIRIVELAGENTNDSAVECCSGTHVHSTQFIHDFVIISDKSIAKGIRRIYAKTGKKALECREYSAKVMNELKIGTKTIKIDWNLIPIGEQNEIKTLLKENKKKHKRKERDS